VVRRLLARLDGVRRGVTGPALTELPLGLQGRFFRAPMPFSVYDRRGRVLSALREHGVSMVVLLAELDECRERARCDLVERYVTEGFDVLHVPAPDFGAPPPRALRAAVARTLDVLRSGTNVVAHCHAGQGRTGILAACLAHESLGLDAPNAIAWIRRLVPGAVEVLAQTAAVHAYCAPRSR
jgi:protein-tyrosine phosphatase